jgi:Coenzyme PQQ synthesis protein D (PqqD)
VVKRDDKPICTTIDEEVVMLSPQAQSYFGLGVVGSAIWNEIERPRRVDELCAILQQEFDIDSDTCQRQVTEFINDLVERGLAHVLADEVKP